MHNEMGRRRFLTVNAAAAAGLAASPKNAAAATAGTEIEPEWRNRQPEMAYRRLGRTGYMVSEIVMGGNTIAPDNNRHVEMAVERGLNYFDTSPAYGGGRSEEGYGRLLRRSSLREKVFVNSKVSIFDSNRNNFYWNMYLELSDAEKKKIDREARELIEKRNIMESRYLGRYGAWQITEIRKAYFSNVMENHYGDRIDRRKEYYTRIINSVEESLKRLETDHLDLFMCPHGANSPEELLIPEIGEALEKLKQDGKIRACGLSAHTDPAYILLTAVDRGIYDAVMIAYSMVNADFCDHAVRFAHDHGVGVISMKAARPLYPDRQEDIWVPPGRLERLHHTIPGDMKVPMKAYLWVLQNPHITCVNSEMKNEDHVRDNLPLAGRKIDLVPLEDRDKFDY